MVIAAGHKSSYTIRWKHESPTITSDDKRGARVGLKGDKPGHVECMHLSTSAEVIAFLTNVAVEINNKRKSGDYTVKESDCNAFLLHLAEWKNKCYGVNNADTKGGTWQVRYVETVQNNQLMSLTDGEQQAHFPRAPGQRLGHQLSGGGPR